MHDPRAALAAGNNADVYQAMFESRSLLYRRNEFAFIGDDVPPPYYSNLTVLAPGHQQEILSELRAAARRFGGKVGFKDSFSEFGLAANGFQTLFEARWIWRSPEARGPEAGWSIVKDDLGLQGWEAAWKRFGSPADIRMFRDSMLGRPEISFWGKTVGDDFVAGCLANISGECVGISNLFFAPGEVDDFLEVTAAVGSWEGHRPIVGYAAGARLEAAQRAGYETVGALQILNADKACL